MKQEIFISSYKITKHEIKFVSSSYENNAYCITHLKFFGEDWEGNKYYCKRKVLCLVDVNELCEYLERTTVSKKNVSDYVDSYLNETLWDCGQISRVNEILKNLNGMFV